MFRVNNDSKKLSKCSRATYKNLLSLFIMTQIIPPTHKKRKKFFQIIFPPLNFVLEIRGIHISWRKLSNEIKLLTCVVTLKVNCYIDQCLHKSISYHIEIIVFLNKEIDRSLC